MEWKVVRTYAVSNMKFRPHAYHFLITDHQIKDLFPSTSRIYSCLRAVIQKNPILVIEGIREVGALGVGGIRPPCKVLAVKEPRENCGIVTIQGPLKYAPPICETLRISLIGGFHSELKPVQYAKGKRFFNF